MQLDRPGPAGTYDFRLAVSSETVLTELPHLERVRRIDELGWTGTVGLEAWASADPVVALQRFRDAFTAPPGPPSPVTSAPRPGTNLSQEPA